MSGSQGRAQGRDTALQRRLARSIADILRSDGLTPGAPVNQMALAARLGVSRSPVRAAMQLLGRAGVVRLDGRGAQLADPHVRLPFDDETDPRDMLLAVIARSRQDGDLPDSVTEADLMRRFGAARTEVAAALRQLAELGVAERKAGFGWRFLAGAEGSADRAASYRFRLLLEPAALLEPDFHADPEWLSDMRKAHQRYLARRWRAADAIDFFEMNAAFHLGLVAFSGNRFLIQATEQQNALRRLRNYSWRLGEERVQVSCAEHLAILDAVAAGDLPLAAERMRRHLKQTAALVAPAPQGRTAR